MKWGMGMDKEHKKKMIATYKNKTVVGGIYCITNTVTGKRYIYTSKDLGGSKNRFNFAKISNTCVNVTLAKEWEEYGGNAFAFEELETLERDAEQTNKEFQNDLDILLQMWEEKMRLENE